MVFNSGESLDKVSEEGFESIRDVPRIDDDELILFSKGQMCR